MIHDFRIGVRLFAQCGKIMLIYLSTIFQFCTHHLPSIAANNASTTWMLPSVIRIVEFQISSGRNRVALVTKSPLTKIQKKKKEIEIEEYNPFYYWYLRAFRLDSSVVKWCWYAWRTDSHRIWLRSPFFCFEFRLFFM